MNKLTRLKLINFISHKDTEYIFRNGEALIIVGDNRDNPSQIGNGAGKSGIIEGIAVGLTGDCVRAASLKELVGRHWGLDYGIVELDYHNTMYRNEVSIKRKIHNSKAQQVELIINGKEEVYSDVNEYNKAILQMLSITKDDLFDFFLITKEHYKPFLTVGDTGKKAIINRFSGADSVDKVVPFIDEDVKKKDETIKAIEAQINSVKGKQEYVTDQIKEWEEENSEEKRKEKGKEIEAVLQAKEEEILGYRLTIASTEEELYNAREDVDKFKPIDYDKLIFEAEVERDDVNLKINDKRKELQTVSSKYEDEANSLKELITTLQECIKDNNKARKDAVKLLTESEAQLAGLIECPKCHHEFVFSNDEQIAEEANADELRATVEEVKSIIEGVDKENNQYEQELVETGKSIEEIEEKIFKEGEAIRKEVVLLEKEYMEKSKAVQDIKKKKIVQDCKIATMEEGILTIEGKLNRLQREQNQLIEERDELQEQLNEPFAINEEQLNKLNEQLLKYMDDEAELQEKLEKATFDKQQTQEWYGNFKNFKSYLANQSIKNIQDYTNMFLQQMGSDLSIEIEGYKLMSNKKLKEQITCKVLRNGFEEGSYGTFSAGERGRVDLAVILAIQTLINLNSCSNGLDLLLLDEIMDSIDSLGIECIIKGLDNVKRTVMLVSQVAINSLDHQTMTIVKENKVSRIEQGCTRREKEVSPTIEQLSDLQDSKPGKRKNIRRTTQKR